MVTEKIRAKILKDFSETGSIRKASRRSGLGHAIVRDVLTSLGIDAPVDEPGRFRKLPGSAVIRAEYEAGASLNQLASKYRCELSSVAQAVRKSGAAMRPRGNMAKALSNSESDEVVRLFGVLGTQTAVAIEMGISQSSVSRYLRMAGIYDGKKASGDRHRSWRGGRIRVGEYVAVMLAKDDPLCEMRQRSGYVLEHRLVMARHLGRPLGAQETVHHINGNKTDNRIENLQLRQGKHGKGARHRCIDCGSTNIESIKL